MHDKPKNRDWVKNAAIIFLAVLLVLTFFSNTIMNRSLPEVATQGVTDGSIVARVRGTGTVVANSNTQVKMEKTRVIRSVLVKVGQQVQAGDVLFTLGEGSSEDIDAAEDKLRQLQTSYNRTAATMPEYNYSTDRRKIGILEQNMNEAQKSMESARKAAGDALTNNDNTISDSYIVSNLVLIQEELNKAIAARDAAKDALKNKTLGRLDLNLEQWKERQASIVRELVGVSALDGDLISPSSGYNDRTRIENQIARIDNDYYEDDDSNSQNGGESGGDPSGEGSGSGSSATNITININTDNVTINSGENSESTPESLGSGNPVGGASNPESMDAGETNTETGNSNGNNSNPENISGDNSTLGNNASNPDAGNLNADSPDAGNLNAVSPDAGDLNGDNPDAGNLDGNNPEASNPGESDSVEKTAEENASNSLMPEVEVNSKESETSPLPEIKTDNVEEPSKTTEEEKPDAEYEKKAQEQTSPLTADAYYLFDLKKEYKGELFPPPQDWKKHQTEWKLCLEFCLEMYNECEENIFLLETDVVEAYEAAVAEVDKWSALLDKYLETGTAEGAIYKSRLEAYRTAKDAYDTAVEALNQKYTDNQSTIAGYNIDLADTWQQIEKAKQKLADLTGGEEAQILARVSGTIQTIDASPGDTKQKDDIIATIEAPDMGYSLSFSVTNDQANRLRPGDTATVSNFYWGTEIVATLNSIKIDQKNPQTNKLLTFDLSGNVTAGSELTLSVGQKSANYDIIIPSSSIRTDANGSFVLKVESKNSPLGNRYIARRVPVEVLASDDSNSAVSADLSFGDYVITTSSAPIKSGDLVRLAAS